jgi:transcriptional regulatory protein LevR
MQGTAKLISHCKSGNGTSVHIKQILEMQVQEQFTAQSIHPEL